MSWQPLQRMSGHRTPKAVLGKRTSPGWHDYWFLKILVLPDAQRAKKSAPCALEECRDDAESSAARNGTNALGPRQKKRSEEDLWPSGYYWRTIMGAYAS